MLRACTLLFLCIASNVPAQAPSLDQIHAALVPLRGGQPAKKIDFDLRGASPALMAIKAQVRDWVDGQVARLPETIDADAQNQAWEKAFSVADLLCSASGNDKDRCYGDDQETADFASRAMIGYLLAPRIVPLNWHTLVVITSAPIICGEDQSAYAYRWRDGAWRRFWQSERRIEPGKPYLPRHFMSVEISANREEAERLVLAVGNAQWCASNWHPVYYELARVPADGSAALPLLDVEEDNAFQGAHDEPIRGAVSHDEALVEFTEGSLDAGVHSFEAVRHFGIRNGQAVRDDPIALSPRAFVETWLAAPWSASSRWLVPDLSLSTSERWWKRLHGEPTLGEFDPTTRCRDGRHWQVGVSIGEAEKPQTTAWFVIAWQPPYRFRLAAISAKPRADCGTADPESERYRTLFPQGDWIGF